MEEHSKLRGLIDKAIASQLNLQAARADLFNYTVKYPFPTLNAPECSVLLEKFKAAKRMNDSAIAEMNSALQVKVKHQQDRQGCQVR